VDGTVLAYESVDEESGSRGMFITRVRRRGDRRVELATGTKTKTLEIVSDGVVRAGGGYLLKKPGEVGAEWPGADGARVRVTSVDKAVSVPAGAFAGCVETVEERGGDARRRTTTVFCPDVGVVSIEVEAWAGAEHGLERAQLKSFGPAVDIGAKGN
jgi:hypothetical protein